MNRPITPLAFILFVVLFTQMAAQDLGVIRITSPVSGCTLGNETVTVRVKNFGGSPFIGSFNLSYRINANTPITESTSATILAGDSLTYTFTASANLSTPGTYSFKAYTGATGDVNPNNDTLLNYLVTNDPVTVGGSVTPNATVCSGNNNGTLTLSGHTGSVLSWSYSTDGGSTWNAIANTTTTQNYLNLATTTLYRADVRSGTCASALSGTATITVDPSPVGGTLSGITTVCGISNSGTITLSGQSGTILSWEFSTDGGNTWSPISNTGTTENYNNLTTSTIYHAVLQQGNCIAYSSDATITVSPATVGGTVSGSTTVCSGSNSGTLQLSGETGNVVRWEYSIDGGSTWINTTNTATSQNYLNLVQTTMYRAVIQSGVCPQANSSPATVTVDPVSAGGITSGSSATVCAGANNGTIALSNFTGAILKWEYSIDNGTTWQNITNTTSSHTFNNLAATTWFHAIVKSGSCPADTSTTTVINVAPLPVTNAGTDTSVSLGHSITLNGSGGGSYSWSPPDGLNNPNLQNPVASPSATTTYTLVVTDANGCTGTATVKVEVLLDFSFEIMNLLTPNGDGKNDVWYIGNIEEYPLCEVIIFTMSDKEVFRASPYNNDWDGSFQGKELADGTYYYILRCPNLKKDVRGFITLLRNKQ